MATALRYRIGANDAPDQPGFQVEAPYGVAPPPGGIWYCNLYDQTGTGAYGPYLPDTDTSRQYGEKVVDPAGEGWVKLIEAELASVPVFGTVEWDNIDGYPINAVLDAYSRTGQRGIMVIAKNPSKPGLVAHPAVVGIIQEQDDDVTADSLHQLRMAAGKGDLPIRVVTFGDQRPWAVSIAEQAKQLGLKEFGVTYDAAGEYGGDITDILLPTTGGPMATSQPAAAVSGADILARARSYIGKYRDPDAPALAREVGQHWPEMASYATMANSQTPWCGIFAAKVASEFGIRPPFGADDLHRWMWVDAWKDVGDVVPIGQQQPGDIVGFIYSSLHHVTFYAGAGRYCGGNQSDAVTETAFSATPSFVRRLSAVAQAMPVVTKPSGQFDKAVAYVLVDEGGNDDDPRDPGGRTSRGIIQTEWDRWRQSHSGLPSDVWQAPQDQVLAIYKTNYWDAMQCDSLPAGVDYAVFDYGVNSGNSRAVKALQSIVGAEVDGEIGPETAGKTAAMDAAKVINALCDQRMAFLREIGTWDTFGRGWTDRVEGHVRPQALAMVGTIVPPVVLPPVLIPPAPAPVPVPQPVPDMAALTARIDQIATEMKAMNDRLTAVEKSKMTDTTVPTPPTTAPAPIDIGASLARIEKLLASRPDTTSQSYVSLKTFISALPNIGAYGSIIAYGVLWALQALNVVGTAGILGGGATPTGGVATAGIFTTLATSLLALFTKKPATS